MKNNYRWQRFVRALIASLLVVTAIPTLTHAQAFPAAPPFLAFDAAAQQRIEYSKAVYAYRDVTYAEIRGYRPLKLDLYLPKATTKPQPAIVWLHGGGWGAGNPRAGGPVYHDWPKVLQDLTARGYVVIAATYRFTSEAQFPAAINDVKAVIRWARLNAANLGIDSSRIGVWGESAGGYLAVLAGTACEVAALEGTANEPGKVSSCVQAVVDWYGPSDFSRMDSQVLPGGRKHGGEGAESALLGCLVNQCPAEKLKAANPLTYIKASTPPFLIIHGDADLAVPPLQSQLLYDALRAAQVPAKLQFIHGADHMFNGASPAEGQMILDEVFAFFDQVLGAKKTR